MKSTSLFLSLDEPFSFARRAFFFRSARFFLFARRAFCFLLGALFSFCSARFFLFARRAFFFSLEKERKLPFFPKFKQGEIKLPHFFVIFRKNSLIFL